MFCPKCNATMPSGQFCSVCGTTLIQPPSVSTSSTLGLAAAPKSKPKAKIIIVASVVATLAIAIGVKVSIDLADSSRKDNLIAEALQFCGVSEADVVRYDNRHVLLSNGDSSNMVTMKEQGCVMSELGGPSNSDDIIFKNYSRETYEYGEVRIVLDYESPESTTEIWVD